MATLLCLAQALLPSLTDAQASAVWQGCHHFMSSSSYGSPQKRTYKVTPFTSWIDAWFSLFMCMVAQLLITLLKTRPALVQDATFLGALQTLLTSSLGACAPSSKRSRLEAAQHLVSVRTV